MRPGLMLASALLLTAVLTGSVGAAGFSVTIKPASVVDYVASQQFPIVGEVGLPLGSRGELTFGLCYESQWDSVGAGSVIALSLGGRYYLRTVNGLKPYALGAVAKNFYAGSMTDDSFLRLELGVGAERDLSDNVALVGEVLLHRDTWTNSAGQAGIAYTTGQWGLRFRFD